MNDIELRILKQNVEIAIADFYLDLLKKDLRDEPITMEEYKKLKDKHSTRFIEDAKRIFKTDLREV